MSQRCIFISYSSKDRKFIIQLAEELRILGYDVWFDQELKQHGGHQWWTEIMEALRACDIFLYAASDNLASSKACRLEYKYACDLGKVVIPVQVGVLNLRNVPGAIQSSQILDVRGLTREQRTDLNRSLCNLPAAAALPSNARDLEPLTPLDEIGKLIEKIDTLSADAKKQDELLSDIGKLLTNSNTYNDAIDLLNRLKKRDDVLIAQNLKRINQMLRMHEFRRFIRLVGIMVGIVFVLIIAIQMFRSTSFRVATTPTAIATTESVAVITTVTVSPQTAEDAPGARVTSRLPTPTIIPIQSTVVPTSITPVISKLAAGSLHTDTFGVSQVYVPAGCFMMGSDPVKDPYVQPNELPKHDVCITQPFWLDKSAVTNAEYDVFVKAGGYTNKGLWSVDGWSWLQSNKITGPESDCTQYSNMPDQPRICVNYYEAEAYATWRGGHLPSEAEWEYAARGAASSPPVFPWGDAFDPSKANVAANATATSKVCAYVAGNSWVDACDMTGNVSQWVADWYETPYSNSSPGNDPTGPDKGQYRVVRGGSWNGTQISVRAAYRSYLFPEVRSNYCGLRPVTN